MCFLLLTLLYSFVFFFNDTATTEIYTNLNTLSLHDALPIFPRALPWPEMTRRRAYWGRSDEHTSELQSHSEISYAVFCLKKKNTTPHNNQNTYRFFSKKKHRHKNLT